MTAARVETWLSSTWHVKVPAPWLEACIDWIQQENGSGSLAQAAINKQVFEQWLLTDLRDLEYPVLPDCISNNPKGELNSFYSIQIDSLVDVSQPAYSQLQKIRKKNTVNEEVTSNTQGTLRSWEAKPTRMLMLQLTDGIHDIQGMEYQPIPVLRSNLSPGTKVLIQGKVAYRLGVLLLKPENVRLLGGEVDCLVEENSEERVLARLIREEDRNPNAERSNAAERAISIPVDEVGPSDEELLASLGENEELMINESSFESGYCTRSTGINSTTSLLPTTESCLQEDPAAFAAETEEQNVPALGNMEEDFYDFPLDDDLLLEEELMQEQIQILNTSQSKNSYPINEGESDTSGKSTGDFLMKRNAQRTKSMEGCFRNIMVQEKNNKSNKDPSNHSNNRLTDINIELEQYSQPEQTCRIQKCHKVDLNTLPFTYLSVLLSNKPKATTVLKIRAFIVTLTRNLTSSGGFSNLSAKISDGTAYLEVDFADEILTSLIGFSAPEMKQLKKDPILGPKIKEGLQNCQRALIDLCCLMTIKFNPSQTKATVIVLHDINANDFNHLKERLNTCCI